MNEEDKELAEMEELLKEIGPSIPVPSPDLRQEILDKSKERWNNKSVFPIRFMMGWAAVVAAAAMINFAVILASPEEKAPENVKEDTLSEEEYDEMKKNLDKVMRGKR